MIRRTLLAAIFASLAGCSPKYEDPTYDVGEAQKALTTTLDAWKQGAIPTLSKRQPPIKFIDDDSRSGLTLTSYEIVDSSTIGPFKDVAVKLELKTHDGRIVSRAATYQISLKPVISISRSDT
jgi:hypothetical protein